MSTTDERAHKFFNEQWGDERIGIHSMCVIEDCIAAAPHLDQDVFIIAGWIHDIGRKIDKDTHHELSISFLKLFLEQCPEYLHLEETLEDCIRNHRTGKMPQTEHGKIFQQADKTSLHNKRWVEYKEHVAAGQ
jgi:HD superfamily phosphodiesterase